MSSSDTLISRDGFVNSPRYTGHLTPPYKRFLKDDAGNAIDLTGVSPDDFTLVLVNQSNPLTVKAGMGTWSVVDPATQGLCEYQYDTADLTVIGNWYLFISVQLPTEETSRAFDPDFLMIKVSPDGGTPVVTVQDINLDQVNGTAIGPSNPVPISIADGADRAQGSTSDTSANNTTIGLLNAIKETIAAHLPGTLTVSGSVAVSNLPATQSVSATSLPLPTGAATAVKQPAIGTSGTPSSDVLSVQGVTSMTPLKVDGSAVTQPISGSVNVGNFPATQPISGSVSVSNLPTTQTVTGTITETNSSAIKTDADSLVTAIGSVSDVAWSGSGNGSAIADLKAIYTHLGNVGISSLPALAAGSNVIGHVIVDSAGTVTITSLPALPAGSNTIGGAQIVDAGGTNKVVIDASGNMQVRVQNANTNGQATMANSAPVTIASNQSPVSISQPTSSTSSLTFVAAVTSSTQLLAANTNRKKMMVHNESTAVLYLAFGSTSSATAYTVQVPANSYFEMPVPPVYTGIIAGIWSSAIGNARITELS
jgi:hypothetical protein